MLVGGSQFTQRLTMEYNELFETEENCKKTLSVLFNFKLGDIPVKVFKVSVEEPSFSFFDCMKYEIPYTYNIKYTVGLENGELLTTDELKIPKMHNGSFLIEGTESVGGVAIRTPVNIIRIEKPIGVFTSGNKMTISSGNFSFKIEKASSAGAVLLIKENPTDKNEVPSSYCLGSYFKSNKLGYTIPEKNLELKDEDPQGEKYPTIYVDKKTNDKFYYLFNRELEKTKEERSDKNNYILTPKDVYDIWVLANTNFTKIDRVTPFDLNFGDSSSSIMRHFKHNLRMRTQIFGKWVRTKNKVNNIYTDPVQRYVDSYFRMQSESSKDLQVANDTNALDQLSQQRKCYLAKTDGSKVPLSYDGDYMGIIDPGKTHEGGGTGIRNELARGLRVTEDGIRIRLIRRDTNEIVWVDLLEHYKSTILATTSWDYDDNNLVIGKNGKIQVSQKGKYRYENPDFKYDYRRVDREDILGYGDAAIPMMNAVDHTRIALGTAQLDQSIPTIGCKPPIVSTGVEKTIYNVSSLNVKSNIDGVVEKITKDYIKVRLSNGTFKSFIIPNPISTRAHTSQFFYPVVNEGDKIKKGQIIIAINSFKDGQLAVTTPLRVAYTDYELGTFEDSTIISESAAKKLGHLDVVSIDIPIFESEEYVFGKENLSFRGEFTSLEASGFQYLNDLCLPNIGDKVDPGQLIFAYLYESEKDMEKVMRLRRLISPETKVYQKVVKRIPRNVLGGVVRDINVTIKNRDHQIATEIYDFYDKIHKEESKQQEEDIGYSIPKVDKSKYVRDDQIGLITIDIEYVNALKIGDKASNRFGTKGLIKMILPDDQMPKLPDGTPIEMIVGAESVMSRKNVAIIYELLLGDASVALWKKSKEVIESNDLSKEEKRKFLIEVLNTLHITKRYSNKSYEELLSIFNEFEGYYQLKVPALSNKYMNHKNLRAIQDLAGIPRDGKYKLKIGNRETTSPVVCGISSVERLHFIAELKSKSTSSIGGNKKNDLAIGSGGQIKSTGQRLGGQEIYALQAYGTMELLEHLKQEEASHGQNIQQELNAIGLGLVMSDEY